MTTFHKRLKHGLRWYDHNAPMPTVRQIAAAVFMALLILILIVAGYLFVSYRDAQAGMLEAQARQIKTEVALVALLNGDPLINDDGMVILARTETAGGPE